MAKTPTPAATAGDTTATDTTTAELQKLQAELQQAREGERRALADYQNVVKRNQEQQLRMVKFANRELVSALLQPLEHLDLAAGQLKDAGLDMVTKQFWHVMEQAGLKEVSAQGQAVDPVTMEVVQAGDNKKTVTQVVKKGYELHGELLQPAKVIID